MSSKIVVKYVDTKTTFYILGLWHTHFYCYCYMYDCAVHLCMVGCIWNNKVKLLCMVSEVGYKPMPIKLIITQWNFTNGRLRTDKYLN